MVKKVKFFCDTCGIELYADVKEDNEDEENKTHFCCDICEEEWNKKVENE